MKLLTNQQLALIEASQATKQAEIDKLSTELNRAILSNATLAEEMQNFKDAMLPTKQEHATELFNARKELATANLLLEEVFKLTARVVGKPTKMTNKQLEAYTR